MLAAIPACLALLLAASARFSAPAASPEEPVADPGSIVRWSAPGTTRCGMLGRSWPALEQTCYYPIDVLRKPGPVSVVRRGEASREVANIRVGPDPYGAEDIELGDIPQAHPTDEDRARNAREQARLGKIFQRKEGPARFTLPLQPPADPLPEGKTFGWTRYFDGKLAPQPHMGADYALTEGTPVVSVADGTVVLAEDLFYPGNAVIVDHGDGLFTMYFHLSEIAVESGREISKGERVGSVGTTGRSTGPHLFFGVRWHGARIDPKYLFADPAKIPSVEKLSGKTKTGKS
jgi:murein DD-endopeptidase MepM/ murein hydrolase activator NlpD